MAVPAEEVAEVVEGGEGRREEGCGPAALEGGADLRRGVDAVEAQAEVAPRKPGAGDVALVEELGDAQEAGRGEVAVEEVAAVGSGPVAGEQGLGDGVEALQQVREILGFFPVEPVLAVPLLLAALGDAAQTGVDIPKPPWPGGG